MSGAAFKLMVAKAMGVYPEQIAIIFNEKDISAEKRSLQELGITPESQPSVVIRPGSGRVEKRKYQ
jgi:hypothetical protein